MEHTFLPDKKTVVELVTNCCGVSWHDPGVDIVHREDQCCFAVDEHGDPL